MAKKHTKTQKSAGARNLFIGATGLVVLGLIVLKGRSSNTPSPPPPQKAELQAMAPLPLDAEVSERLDPKEKQAALDKARALGAMYSYLGVSTLRLNVKDDRLQIPIHFKPEKLWCRGGDIDTMKHASDDLGAPNILISLEPLGEGKGDFVRTNVLNFYKEFEQVFQIKEAAASQGLGLYICSDSKNQNSCKGKPVRSHEAMSKELAAAGSRSEGKPDYLLYFQPITISEKNLETYKIDDFSEDFQASMKGYLKRQKGIDEANAQTAWNLSRAMRSLPAKILDERIVVTLSHNDPQCMGAGDRQKN